MWDEFDRMISDSIDPVMAVPLRFIPMKDGGIKGAVPDPDRPQIPELRGILDCDTDASSAKPGVGREAKFKAHALVRRAELSIDQRLFKGLEPQKGDLFVQVDGRSWQVAQAPELDGARYDMQLMRIS